MDYHLKLKLQKKTFQIVSLIQMIIFMIKIMKKENHHIMMNLIIIIKAVVIVIYIIKLSLVE